MARGDGWKAGGWAQQLRAWWGSEQEQPPEAESGVRSSRGTAPADDCDALDHAYSEFCRCREQGRAVDVSSFCARFPNVGSSLRRLLIADQQFDAHLVQHLAATLGGAPTDWPQVGTSFLGFEIEEELGRGGLARVYRATQPDVGRRTVVLKVSPHDTAEADTLGRLTHDHIVPIYSRHDDPPTGLTAVCMPYLGRATLATIRQAAFRYGRPPRDAQVILDAARLPQAGTVGLANGTATGWKGDDRYVRAIARIGRDLADALAYTHSRGILHGDLKPSNVLVTPQGHPMLLDFNLSIDLQARRYITGGTLPYMAPESLERLMAPLATRGSGDPIDPRADLYSLGVILYELLTGELPPDDGRRPLVTVDDRWSRILESCLAHDPRRRPATASHLVRALDEYLEGHEPAPRRHGRAIAAGVSIALFLLVSYLSSVARPQLGRGTAEATTDVTPSASAVVEPPPFARDKHLEIVPGVRLGAGLRSLVIDHPALAVQYLTRELRRQPHDPQYFYARGHAFRRLAEQTNHDLFWQAARGDYEQARRWSRSGRASACLAYCRSMNGPSSQSIKLYQEALDDGYDASDVRNNLGWEYASRGDWRRAREEFDRAVTLEPQCATARWNRARLIGQVATCESAHEIPLDQLRHDLREALADEPTTPDQHLEAAWLYTLLGELTDDRDCIAAARRHLDQAGKRHLDPATPARLAPLGTLLAEFSWLDRWPATSTLAMQMPSPQLVAPSWDPLPAIWSTP